MISFVLRNLAVMVTIKVKSCVCERTVEMDSTGGPGLCVWHLHIRVKVEFSDVVIECRLRA